VYAPASLVRDAVRHHREHGGGVVVTLSSWAAQQGSGNPHLLAYASSKAALHTLTRTVARAHAREGVLAYVVAPGIVRTDMSVRSAATTGGEEAVTARLAMREWVPPEEAGALIAWLASGSVRHLTGATLDLNGASYPR
jgi:NAD(P)-dependent dehydrogenase (short-subunit alcohol dehydrogenase family)